MLPIGETHVRDPRLEDCWRQYRLWKQPLVTLQPVMLVLSLLGDDGNDSDCRRTSRVCGVLPIVVGLSILFTITSPTGVSFLVYEVFL